MGWNDLVDAHFEPNGDDAEFIHPSNEPDFDAMAEEYMAMSFYEEGGFLPGSLSDVEY